MKRVFVGAKAFYREHTLAYPNQSSKTCGGPEAFTSTTIFKKCGGKYTFAYLHLTRLPQVCQNEHMYMHFFCFHTNFHILRFNTLYGTAR